MDGPQPSEFSRERHVAFLEAMLHKLPKEYASQEINHLTLAYFAVSSLSLLRDLDRVDKDQIASWILSFQAKPKETCDVNDGTFFGFCGSRSCQFSEDLCQSVSNLAGTYSALAILKVVGYDFEEFDTSSILKSMRKLQMPDGSFMPIDSGAETDLRFVYCAAAVSSLLNDWSGMDKEKAKDYVVKCQSYDGGFGLTPGSESHGGGTYCAVAALFLMEFIQTDCKSGFSLPKCTVIDIPSLIEWCLQRQGIDGGFQGRANKPSDTCYAFWVGGVLKMLGLYHLINKAALSEFLLSCQSPYGGFTKFQNEMLPDIYHSYYGFAALSLLEEKELEPLCVELGLAVFNPL